MNNSNHNMETPKKIIEPLITIPKPRPQMVQPQPKTPSHPSHVSMKLPVGGTSKYADLLHVIEELGHHIRPSYAGHRGSAEKIKQGIIKARLLVKECIMETEKSARQ